MARRIIMPRVLIVIIRLRLRSIRMGVVEDGR